MTNHGQEFEKYSGKKTTLSSARVRFIVSLDVISFSTFAFLKKNDRGKKKKSDDQSGKSSKVLLKRDHIAN